MQILDFGGEDVLAAGHDHLVVAAADVEQALLVEVADVAGGHQPVDDLLVAAAGVALEREGVADEDPADLTLGHLLAVLVEELDLHALDDGPDGRRVVLEILRAGDGGERDLGRAVQVVDHRAQRPSSPGGQFGAQLRTGHEHDAQARQVGLGSVFSNSSRMRDNITGTTTTAVTLCFSMSSSTVRRLEPAAQHQRQPSNMRDGGVQEAQRMEHRRGQRGDLAGLERHVRQDPADRRQ